MSWDFSVFDDWFSLVQPGPQTWQHDHMNNWNHHTCHHGRQIIIFWIIITNSVTESQAKLVPIKIFWSILLPHGDKYPPPLSFLIWQKILMWHANSWCSPWKICCCQIVSTLMMMLAIIAKEFRIFAPGHR